MSETKLANPKQGPTGLSKFDYGQYAGRGYEGTDASDYKLPFVYLAQDDSKALKVGPDGKTPRFPEKFIPGLKVGDFFCPTTKQVFGPNVLMLWALTQQEYAEWTPYNDGGGFHGSHSPGAPIVLEALKKSGGKKIHLVTADGKHELQQTFKVFAVIVNENLEIIGQGVFPCASTKIPPYQTIRTRLSTVKGAGGGMPLYASVVLASSFPKEGKADKIYQQLTLRSWKGPDPDGDVLESLIDPASAAFQAADKLREAILGGTVKVEEPDEEGREARAADESGRGDAVFAKKGAQPAGAGAR